VYTSVYQNKFEEVKKRRREGKVVKPSEIEEIKEGLMYRLEEYRNVSLFIIKLNRDIMECGKERLKLSDRADVLKSLLEELGDMARAIYEEEVIKKQIELAARRFCWPCCSAY